MAATKCTNIELQNPSAYATLPSFETTTTTTKTTTIVI